MKINRWEKLCRADALIDNMGVCARYGAQQVALFRIRSNDEIVCYAVSNRDPQGHANVISRGLIASVSGEPVVVSPLTKHYYSLVDGRCLEAGDYRLTVYPIRVTDEAVYIQPAVPLLGEDAEQSLCSATLRGSV